LEIKNVLIMNVAAMMVGVVLPMTIVWKRIVNQTLVNVIINKLSNK